MQHKAPNKERLGPTDPLGVSYTVRDLAECLIRVGRDMPIVSDRNNELGIAIRLHTFVDPKHDYISFINVSAHPDEDVRRGEV